MTINRVKLIVKETVVNDEKVVEVVVFVQNEQIVVYSVNKDMDLSVVIAIGDSNLDFLANEKPCQKVGKVIIEPFF